MIDVIAMVVFVSSPILLYKTAEKYLCSTNKLFKLLTHLIEGTKSGKVTWIKKAKNNGHDTIASDRIDTYLCVQDPTIEFECDHFISNTFKIFIDGKQIKEGIEFSTARNLIKEIVSANKLFELYSVIYKIEEYNNA